MNKQSAYMLESLALAASHLVKVVQTPNKPPDPDFIEIYLKAQKAIDEMAVFIVAEASNTDDIASILQDEE